MACLTMLLAISASAEDSLPGQTLFSTHCSTCHGESGDGNGPVSETLVLKPRDFALAAFKFDADADWETGTDADLAEVIRRGPAAFGGSGMMPGFSHLSDEEIAGLIRFIRSRENAEQ